MGKKQNPIIRYTEMIYSQPHLITQESFKVITDYLQARNKGMLDISDMDDFNEDDDDENEDQNYDPQLKIGVIKVCGSLTNKPVMTMCGEVGTSYEGILDQAEDLIEMGATNIILQVDSGGGEAFGCFVSAQQLRSMVDEAGISLTTYVDGMACSAAYAWAVVADEVIAHPDADLGSIGVLVALTNSNEYLKKEGIVRTFITAGEDKVPFDDEGNFKESFLADLQYKVDYLYENFVNHVSEYTGLSAEVIKGTQAKVFMAQDALKIGMINQIMTEPEFTSYIVNKQKGASNA